MKTVHPHGPPVLSTFRRALVLFVGCTAIGTACAAGFGLVCGALWDILHGGFDNMATWGMWSGLTGALAGAIVGLNALADRLVSARYGTAAPSDSYLYASDETGRQVPDR